MRRPTLALLLVLAMMLGACSKAEPEVTANEQVPADQAVEEVPEGEEGGEAAPASAGDADAVWVADGLAYTSAPDSMPADGAALALEVVGGLPHNVVFEGFQGDQVLVDGPGEGVYSANVSVPAGTYTYYCSIVGHRAAGMEGTITVG